MLRRPPPWRRGPSTGVLQPALAVRATTAAGAPAVPADLAAPVLAAPGGARRFRGACLLGALAALVPFTWLLSSAGLGLLRPVALGGFYDAQAHSLLDGHWDVPAEALSIEGFEVDGRTYMYFGPMPALLRLPVAAVTHRFDGRLTALSLLAALVVALVAATDLSWRIRRLVRGDEPVGRGEAAVAGAAIFLLGTGSSLLFLASAPVVYHEAILWGVALALAASAATVAYVTGRSARALAAAAALATLAVLARPSVGLGPVLALGLLLAGEAWVALRHLRGGGRRPRHLLGLAVGTALPVVLYAAVNIIKFGSAFGVPWGAQALMRTDPVHRDFLRRAGGTLFGLDYAPTGVVQYVRPDALAVNRVFPWVDFPGPASPLFDVPFDVIDRCSSLTATMPWLVGLAVVGAVVLVARRSAGGRRAGAALWAPILGALAAAPVTVAIAYIAQRYLADFVPLLVLPGLVGLHHLLGSRSGVARAGLALVALGGLVAVGANLALGIRFQGLYGPATDDAQRAQLVGWQTTADDLLPGDQAPPVRRLALGDELPAPARAGGLVVVGRCAGLYQSDGQAWRPVELTGAVGRARVRTRLAAGARGESAELLGGGSGAQARSLAVEVVGDGRVALVFRYAGRDPIRSRVLDVGDGEHELQATFDRRLHTVDVRFRDEVVLGDVLYGPGDDDVRVARDFPAPVEALPLPTPACEGLGG